MQHVVYYVFVMRGIRQVTSAGGTCRCRLATAVMSGRPRRVGHRSPALAAGAAAPSRGSGARGPATFRALQVSQMLKPSLHWRSLLRSQHQRQSTKRPRPSSRDLRRRKCCQVRCFLQALNRPGKESSQSVCHFPSPRHTPTPKVCQPTVELMVHIVLPNCLHKQTRCGSLKELRGCTAPSHGAQSSGNYETERDPARVHLSNPAPKRPQCSGA